MWESIVTELKPGIILATLLYSFIGLGLFGGAMLIIALCTPFSIRKEIEEDQNTALGIIIGSVFIGIAIIVAAAIT